MPKSAKGSQKSAKGTQKSQKGRPKAAKMRVSQVTFLPCVHTQKSDFENQAFRPKSAKGSQKRCQRVPKSAKREPKGAQREAKWSPGEALTCSKSRKNNFCFRKRFGREKGAPRKSCMKIFVPIWAPFGLHFGSQIR